MKQTITQPSYAVNNVQQLPDIVKNQATSVKTTMDKTGADTKTYLVNLTAELNGNDGSKKIGHSSPNFLANNVSDGLEELKTDLQSITQGSVADGSITDQKLSNTSGQIKETVANLQTQITALTEIIGTSTIPTTGWVAHSGDNTLKYSLAIVGVMSTSWVDITIDKEYQDTALDAEINPTIEEYNGGVIIYANTAPAVAIPIRYKVVK